jgi:hypothetical protein
MFFVECGGSIANWRNGRRVSRGDQILPTELPTESGEKRWRGVW